MYCKRKGERVENSRLDLDVEECDTDNGLRRRGFVDRRIFEGTTERSTYV